MYCSVSDSFLTKRPNKVDVFPAKQLASCREASIFYSDHLESDAFLCRTWVKQSLLKTQIRTARIQLRDRIAKNSKNRFGAPTAPSCEIATTQPLPCLPTHAEVGLAWQSANRHRDFPATFQYQMDPKAITVSLPTFFVICGKSDINGNFRILKWRYCTI